MKGASNYMKGASDDMKRCLALALALLLAGCAYSSVRVNSDGSTTTTSSGASVSIGARAGFGLALIGIGPVAAEHGRERSATPGPLDPGRRINEQDCTRPIEDPGANLKCR